jgi:hypothetical protein
MITNNSAFANQATTEAWQAAMMAKSLGNLANATIQKKDTVEKLVTANKKLAKALASANATIAQLHLPNPPNPLPTPSTGTTNNCCPSHGSGQAGLGPNWLLLDARF